LKKKLGLILLILMLSVNSTTAQKMAHQHHDDSKACTLCCCEKELKKCNHLCHRMPENYQIQQVAGAPSTITDDVTTKEWFDKFVTTMNKGMGKLGTWANAACIEMCEYSPKVIRKQSQTKSATQRRFDFKHIKSMTVSCYGPSSIRNETLTPIVDQLEIKTIMQSLKQKNRFPSKGYPITADIRIYIEDGHGNNIEALRVAGNQALTFDLKDKYYYRLTRQAERILDRYHSCP